MPSKLENVEIALRKTTLRRRWSEVEGSLSSTLPSSSPPPASVVECRLRFPLPPLPPQASSSISTSGACESRLSDFEKLKVLGHKNGGTVYKVRHRRSSSIYALKLLNYDDSSSLRRREIEILRRIDSPSIVRCHAVLPTPSGDAAVLKLMDGEKNYSIFVTVDSGMDCIGDPSLWRCGSVEFSSLDVRDELVDELLDSAIQRGGGGGRVYTVVVVEREGEVRVVVGKHRHAWVVGKVSEADAGEMIGEIFVKLFMNGVFLTSPAGTGPSRGWRRRRCRWWWKKNFIT